MCAEDIAGRAARRATARSESGKGGAIGSVRLVAPMFSANVAAAGLLYRGNLRRNSDFQRSISAQILLLFATIRTAIIRDDSRSFPQFATMRPGASPLGYGSGKGDQGQEKKLPGHLRKVLCIFNQEEHGAAADGVFYLGEVGADPIGKSGQENYRNA